MKRARVMVLGVTLLAVIAGSVGFVPWLNPGSPGRGVVAPPRFSATAGERLEYAFDLTTQGWTSPGALRLAILGRNRSATSSPRQDLDSKVRGRLVLTFGAASSREADPSWQVEGRLAEATFDVNGVRVADATALAAAFHFSFTPRGEVGPLTFEGSPSALVQMACQTAVFGLQLVLPETHVSTWRSRERATDAGSWLVDCRASAPALPADTWNVRKRWVARVRPPASEGRPVSCDTEVRKSAGRIAFRSGEAWLQTARWRRLVRDRTDGVTFAGYETVFRAERVPNSSPLPRWAKPSPVAPGPAVDEAPVPPPPTFEESAPVEIEQAVEAFVTQCDRDWVHARDEILSLLRRRADAPSALARYLDANGPQLKVGHETALWLLLAETGTMPSQQALLAVLLESSFSDHARLNALAHVTEVPHPDPSLVEGLWRLHDGTDASAGATQRTLRSTSLLVVGALGHREHGDPDLATLIAAELGRRLAAASSTEARHEVLLALGNQGDARALPALATVLEDEDRHVRAAGYQAMRRMREPEAAALVMRGFEQETDVRVCLAALTTLEEMSPSQAVSLWTRQRLDEKAAPAVQAAFARLVGRDVAKDPEAEAALRGLLARRPPKAVRKEIYRFVR